MNNIITSIFLKIAEKFGLTLQPKKKQYTDFDDVGNFSVTATLSDRLATLTLMDSVVNVLGNNARADYLDELLTDMWNTTVKYACVLSLGTGDVLLKPATDGENFRIDLIENENFAITSMSGNKITGCIIKCDEFTKDNAIYQRFEYHSLDNGNYVIQQSAFKGNNEIPLTSVSKWADIEPETIITNVDNMLFGRIKCPTLNKKSPNSVNGVPITYGLDEVSNAIKESYHRYNKEFADKETKIFADKNILEKDSKGNVHIPNGMNNLFVKIANRSIDNTMIDTYSPDIRDVALDNAIERNYRMLELGVGIGEGVLSKSTLTYTNTDEVKASRSATYAYMCVFQKGIYQGISDLLYALNVLMNVNNTTPMGDYELKIDWSSSYIEATRDKADMLLQGKSINEIQDGEYRAWLLNEDLEDAQQKVAEIKQQNITTIDTEPIE